MLEQPAIGGLTLEKNQTRAVNCRGMTFWLVPLPLTPKCNLALHWKLVRYDSGLERKRNACSRLSLKRVSGQRTEATPVPFRDVREFERSAHQPEGNAHQQPFAPTVSACVPQTGFPGTPYSYRRATRTLPTQQELELPQDIPRENRPLLDS
jgi:hypothetical protein